MPRIEKRDENKVGIKHMDRDVLSRLLGLIFRDNRLGFTVVIVCILVSVFTNVANSMFLSNLIDDYLAPMLASGSTDFSGLARAVTGMACIYVAGVIAIFVREQLMARITQGTMKDIRDQMFSHMQSLPIRYFDTHIHGTIMSYYSNDTDTLRQMISQSIPNMIMSLVMIVAVFISMLITSPVLTACVLVTLAIIMLTARFIGSHSGRYFIRQQNALGDINGYIEEMVEGQRVVQVFCH